MNSIRNLFQSAPQQNGMFGNMMEFFQRFQRFAKNPVGEILSMNNVNVPKNFQGGPQELVSYLVSTGQISQEQLQQFGQMANQFQNLFPRN